MRTVLAIHWRVERLVDPHTCTCGRLYNNHRNIRVHLQRSDSAPCLAEMMDGLLLWYHEEMADKCNPTALEALRVGI